MPRKATAKKAVSQRTFRLPANLVSAFDAVCEHFDEPGDRVARKFFEDALRALVEKHDLPEVSKLLGVEKRSPFDVLPAPTYSHPVQHYGVSWKATIEEPLDAIPSRPFPTGDLVLPNGGPPIPRQVDEG